MNPRPNILFITADQFRWDAMGHIGRFPVETPNLDALAQSGMSLRCYSPNAICVPCRASIVTGQPSCVTGVYYNDQGWSRDLPTLGQELSHNGYFCSIVGKTHFFPRSRTAGFQRVYSEDDYKFALKRAGHAPARPNVSDSRALANWSYRTEPEDIPHEWYEPVHVGTKAVKEIERLSRERDSGIDGCEPFLLWASFLQPHTPCVPPEPWFSRYKDVDFGPINKTEAELAQMPAAIREYHQTHAFLSDEHILQFRRQYMASVSIVDEQVGRLIDALDNAGIRDNTLIVFTSDHGDYLGDHHLQQKSFYHDASSRVPFLVSGSGVKQGKDNQTACSLLDVFPTFLDYVGLRHPDIRDEEDQPIYRNEPELPGSSLWPALSGTKTLSVRDIYAESGIHGQSLMLLRGLKKYIYYPQTGETESFDLKNDPEELENHYHPNGLSTFPESIQVALKVRAAEMDQWKNQRYYFKGRIRPMFS